MKNNTFVTLTSDLKKTLVKKTIKQNPGISYNGLAKKLGLDQQHKTACLYWINKLIKEGQVMQKIVSEQHQPNSIRTLYVVK